MITEQRKRSAERPLRSLSDDELLLLKELAHVSPMIVAERFRVALDALQEFADEELMHR